MPGMAPRTGLEGPEDLDMELPDEAICYGCGGRDGHDGPCIPGMGCPEEEGGHVDRDEDYDLSKSFLPPGERQFENKVTEFDKFMDRIVVDEHQRQKIDRKTEDNPQRRRAARIQDRPMNKTRWGGR